MEIRADFMTPCRRYLLIVSEDNDGGILRSILDRSTGAYIGYCVAAALAPTTEQRAAKLQRFINRARRESKTAASTESYIRHGRILSRGIVHLLEPDTYRTPGTREDMPAEFQELWGRIETDPRVLIADSKAGYRSGFMPYA